MHTLQPNVHYSNAFQHRVDHGISKNFAPSLMNNFSIFLCLHTFYHLFSWSKIIQQSHAHTQCNQFNIQITSDQTKQLQNIYLSVLHFYLMTRFDGHLFNWPTTQQVFRYLLFFSFSFFRLFQIVMIVYTQIEFGSISIVISGTSKTNCSQMEKNMFKFTTSLSDPTHAIVQIVIWIFFSPEF